MSFKPVCRGQHCAAWIHSRFQIKVTCFQGAQTQCLLLHISGEATGLQVNRWKLLSHIHRTHAGNVLRESARWALLIEILEMMMWKLFLSLCSVAARRAVSSLDCVRHIPWPSYLSRPGSVTGILIAVLLRGLSGNLNVDHTQWLLRHTDLVGLAVKTKKHVFCYGEF